MKIYCPHEILDFTPEEFKEYIETNNIELRECNIEDANIRKRRFLSNKGDCLELHVRWGNGLLKGGVHNIGFLGRKNSYERYCQFLDELECKKIGYLYRVKSIIGKKVFNFRSKNKYKWKEHESGIVLPQDVAESKPKRLKQPKTF